MLLTCVDPQPGGPWEELKRASHRVMQRPGCVLSHSSLQVAQKAPEYPGPTACVPREVSGPCVCLLCKNHWTPLCAYLRLPTPTPPTPRFQVGCLRPRQTGSCWRQPSATGSCGKPRFPQRRTAAGVVHTHLRFQRCAAAAAAHQIGPCHAAANESCALGSTSQGGQPIGAG